MEYPWGGLNPYNDYSSHIRRLWGCRVQKISVDAGLSCPNRDGSIGRGGCAWCTVASFVPAYCATGQSIADQVSAGMAFFSYKYSGQKYLVYFQAYSGSYGDADSLRQLYEEALSVDGVVGIVVGTRPDTVSDSALAVLRDLSTLTSVNVELGIESTKDATLQAMGRGHDFLTACQTVHRLYESGIKVGAHVILGLPGETPADFLEHARRLNELPISSLKIHHLQILEGTRLAVQYRQDPSQFNLFDSADYLEVLDRFIGHLRPDIVIERLCNEAPEALLVAPRWNGTKNFALTHRLVARLRDSGRYQGCDLSESVGVIA